MTWASITGWGMAVPGGVLANSDLEAMIDTSDEWIRSRTGIQERHILRGTELPSEIGALAARRALAAAGYGPDDVDFILVTTCSGDRSIPATANALQHHLGNDRAGAMDLNAGCSGYVYGLQTATSLVQTGVAKRLVLVAAEGMTSVTDYQDRSTCIIFGDGAGALVLEPSDEPVGCLDSTLFSDASGIELLTVRAGMAEIPASHESVDAREHYLKMEGGEVFRRAVTGMAEAAGEVLARSGLSIDEIDLVIPHQANQRIIDATAKKLGFGAEKVVSNIARFGNTSSATIPIALVEALAEGRVQPHANLLLVSFGAGFSIGASLVRWGDRVAPIGDADTGARLPEGRPATIPSSQLTRAGSNTFEAGGGS